MGAWTAAHRPSRRDADAGEACARSGRRSRGLRSRRPLLATASLTTSGLAEHLAPHVLSLAQRPDRILEGELYASSSRLDWRTLLKRTFDTDLRVCVRCGGKLTVRAVLTDPAVIAKMPHALRRASASLRFVLATRPPLSTLSGNPPAPRARSTAAPWPFSALLAYDGLLSEPAAERRRRRRGSERQKRMIEASGSSKPRVWKCRSISICANSSLRNRSARRERRRRTWQAVPRSPPRVRTQLCRDGDASAVAAGSSPRAQRCYD